jgi:hypothetical protein
MNFLRTSTGHRLPGYVRLGGKGDGGVSTGKKGFKLILKDEVTIHWR